MNASSGRTAGTHPRSVFHMRRLAITLSVLAAVVLATGLSAQSKDFSGKWAPDADKNAAAMSGGRGPTGMTITMDAKTMKVERQLANGASSCTYNLDGT